MSARSGYAIDFHVHTRYSIDSLTPPRLAIEVARRRGLDGIAVTDHDTVEGALEAVRANPYPDFLVIPGIEVKSDAGDVIALHVREQVHSRRFDDVIAEIHELGGVVYLPHPVRTFKKAVRTYTERPGIDLCERYNGRYNAGEFAISDDVFAAHRIPVLCGSDAHFPWEVGLFRTHLPGLPCDAQSLLSLARAARLTAAPRGELALRTGITLGAMIKDIKRKRYAKVVTLTASLPWRALRRTARLALQRRLSTRTTAQSR
jgi:predicted metal-dependent phosphoesterase TrpH